ncbi:MAG TPA: Sec-independent protein translocase protein TatB [Zeimonas sp.]|jgi:sec-independent protein translocase protein TatB|nr:Sec-independent protein translocase protein TatB [Zeimonas sp.]
MFDFGFSEMVVVAVVGLIVLGPERLPKVARQAGQWLGKLQRYVADVKADINRQMELDELRNLQSEVSGAARELKDSLESAVGDAQTQFDSISADLQGGASSSSETTPVTDWDQVYAHRRTRERIRERRLERERALGQRRPARRR